MFPRTRLRRLRRSENLRRLVRETSLAPQDLVLPLFVVAGSGVKSEISSMPGHYHLSADLLEPEIGQVVARGIGAVLVFGIPPTKDETAAQAYAAGGVVQGAVQRIKDISSELIVMTDVCLCGYLTHGHCGLVRAGEILNDETTEVLCNVAVSHAEAGVDLVAPSDMMDGRVGAIRSALDDKGFTSVGIMAYAVKYASAFYGPFREAVASAPQFGDRRSYQMDPPNIREALREVQADVEEGADIIMVKPALAYLDVIAAVARQWPVPLAAYSVSGEFAMIKAAAQQGWLDEQAAALEILTSIKRAGADIIITYFAKDAVRWLEGWGESC